jgi:hypothetical protein
MPLLGGAQACLATYLVGSSFDFDCVLVQGLTSNVCFTMFTPVVAFTGVPAVLSQ